MIKSNIIFIVLLVGMFSEGLCTEDSTGTTNKFSGWSFHNTLMGTGKTTFRTTKNVAEYLETHPRALAVVCYSALIWGTLKVCSIAFHEEKIPGLDTIKWIATGLNNAWITLKLWTKPFRSEDDDSPYGVY